MLFDSFESRITVRGEIEVVKPLHIGAAEDNLDPVQVDSPVIKDSNRKPLIPGSSMKGVLRSILESLFSNPKFNGRYRSCNILDREQQCIKKKDVEKIENENKLEHKKIAEEIYKKCCDVCKMFGNGHIASKIKIKDMFCTKFLGFERRDGVGIDRDSGTSYHGAKYGYEIVPAGTRFDFCLIAENLEKNHMRVFEYIIELLRNGEVSIGGKTSRGLGQIKLHLGADGYEKITANDIALKLTGTDGGEKDV